MNIDDLNRLKHCDQGLLKRAIGPEDANILVTKYLVPNYLEDHFFGVMRVCKEIKEKDPIEAGEKHISDLPNELLNEICSYLSPLDIDIGKAAAVPMVGVTEEG